MNDQIQLVDERIPIYFLPGEQSWIDIESPITAQEECQNVSIDTIKEVGHCVSAKNAFCPYAFHFSFLQTYTDVPTEFDMYSKRILVNKE